MCWVKVAYSGEQNGAHQKTASNGLSTDPNLWVIKAKFCSHWSSKKSELSLMCLSLLAWCKVDLNPIASHWKCSGWESSASHHAPSPLPAVDRRYQGSGHNPAISLCCAHPVLPNYLLGLLAPKIIELGSAVGGSCSSCPLPTCGRYSGTALHDSAVLCKKYHFLALFL